MTNYLSAIDYFLHLITAISFFCYRIFVVMFLEVTYWLQNMRTLKSWFVEIAPLQLKNLYLAMAKIPNHLLVHWIFFPRAGLQVNHLMGLTVMILVQNMVVKRRKRVVGLHLQAPIVTVQIQVKNLMSQMTSQIIQTYLPKKTIKLRRKARN